MGAWFNSFAAGSSDALAHFNLGGECTFANERFAQIVEREKVVAEHFSDLLAGLSTLYGKFLHAYEGVSVNGGEHQFRCTETIMERSRELACRLIPVEGAEGFLLEIRDVSELEQLRRLVSADRMSRRQEELLMKRRRELFFGLLDELPSFVYLQRRDYTVAFANKKVRKLYGEPEGRLCYEVFAGRTSPCTVCPTFEVFDNGRAVDWEFTDNDGRTFLIYDYPFEDETGEPLVLELGVDITELKNVEKELFQAQKLKAIGVLAGGIAHDLNNNLVPIIFNVEYAKSKIDSPAVVEPLDDALQAAQRAAKLVAQVLEYSRQQEPGSETVKINPIIRNCVGEIVNNLDPSAHLRLDLPDSTYSVSATTTQIEQLVHNLVRNAEYAMPSGGNIYVSLRSEILLDKRKLVTGELAPGRYAVLEVQDTGLGIRNEDLQRIFEPFFTKRKSRGGTGMGLAVVHSIVIASGGGIDVESSLGVGTLFTVYLPQVADVNEVLQGELCFVDGNNITILLVDDDVGALSAMCRVFAEAGFTVDTAVSGDEGLTVFQNNPDKYNLVIADHSMPGMTGLEMASRILETQPDTRVLICTGHIEPSLDEQAREIGIEGFVRKPMQPKSLIETVKRHCRYC